MTTPLKGRKVKTTRLGFLSFRGEEITKIEVCPENTVEVLSFGDRVPCTVQISYTLPTKKKGV